MSSAENNRQQPFPAVPPSLSAGDHEMRDYYANSSAPRPVPSRLIPGPVVPLIPAHLSPYPSLQAQQDAGAAAAWFPALTTMAGLQANWDFLSDFQQRGTLALDALRAQAAQSPWGVASNGRILDEPRLRSMEEMYLPD
jgi:hypothetical protein